MDITRRKFIKAIGAGTCVAVPIVLGVGGALYTRHNSPSLEDGVGKQIIIPGTWSYDIDSMSLCGDSGFLTNWIKSNNVEMSFNYRNLEYGCLESQVDIAWYISAPGNRVLTPKNQAQIARLGQVNFDNVTMNDLISAKYSYEGINGSDDKNQLEEGTVIAVKTTRGSYVKMRVDGYLPLRYKNQPEVQDPNYNMVATLVALRNN